MSSTDIQYEEARESVETGNKLSNQYAFFGFVLGLFVPIIAWTMELLLKKESLSLDAIWRIHVLSPVHFIMDSTPIALALLSYILSSRFYQYRQRIENQLNEKNKIIQKNALFAKLIGEKDFSKQFDVDRDDEIGNSLLIMRNKLEEATLKESEQYWIAQGKDKISNILRLHNNISTLAYETLVTIINYTKSIQGAFYLYDDDNKKLVNIATYAYNRKKYISQEFQIGSGLIGQAAFEMEMIYRKEIPEEYVTLTSGILGDKKPSTLIICPLINDEKLQGVIELASLQNDIPELTLKFLKELSVIIAQTVFNLKVNAKTEKLLKEARIMTEELKENEEQLRQNAEEMRATQEELQKTNQNLEGQIQEVEKAQKRLYTLLENASEVISIYDEEAYIQYESPSVKHILGYSPDDVVGKNAFEVIYRGDNSIFKQTFQELLANPMEPVTFEHQYQKSDGETLWLETTGRNLLTNIAIRGILFNTRDITVRKEAERAQRMSGQMKSLSENSLDMITRVDNSGKFYYVNPVLERYTGIKSRDVMGKTFEEIEFDDVFKEMYRHRLNQVISTLALSEAEVNLVTLEGEKIVRVNAIPEFNETKELETILIVAHDITEQKRIEQEITEKNKQVADSINYAQRIQKAILPNSQHIREKLPESFIFYKPRDIISGDFPWFFERGDSTYIAVVDCTGHGVPGALLSFIGYFILNSIVDHDRELNASEVLDQLHMGVRRTLKQDRADANAKDGMDIAFCKIDFKKNELQYAGAHRPLYYLRGQEIEIYKGSHKAIGGIPPKKKGEDEFENHVITFQKGDKIFFFSDGLPDQTGGVDGRKYLPMRVRQLIIDHYDYSMSKFAQLFARDFHMWKGDHKQIDDVLLIGIEF